MTEQVRDTLPEQVDYLKFLEAERQFNPVGETLLVEFDRTGESPQDPEQLEQLKQASNLWLSTEYVKSGSYGVALPYLDERENGYRCQLEVAVRCRDTDAISILEDEIAHLAWLRAGANTSTLPH